MSRRQQRVTAQEGDCVNSIVPVQAVNHRKRKQLERSAMVWIDRHGRDAESYRFDVVGVLLHDAVVRVCHVENAFNLVSSA